MIEVKLLMLNMMGSMSLVFIQIRHSYSGVKWSQYVTPIISRPMGWVVFRQVYPTPSFDKSKNSKSPRVLNLSKLQNDPIRTPLPNLRQLLHTFLHLDSHVPKPLPMRHE